jgi:hypothetical protein
MAKHKYQLGNEIRTEAKAIRKAERQDGNNLMDRLFQIIAGSVFLVATWHEAARHMSLPGDYGNMAGGIAVVAILLYFAAAPIFRNR